MHQCLIMLRASVLLLVLGLLTVVSAVAGTNADGLRVVTWNVTNYGSGRVQAFSTAIYGEFEGRSMSPDIIIGQEFLSQTGVNNFLNILNTAPGSPGDWEAAPFNNGADTDNAFFYRTSRVDFLGMTIVSVGSPAPNHPRDVNRYDIRPVGYASEAAVIAMYSSHMKAGNTATDRARRLLEAQIIRADAESLPAEWNFMLGADLNIPTWSQDAYQWLINSQANNDGRFFDPISTPGSWQNNFNFRFVHTQDPIGAGGMDDRYDQLLVSASLLDGQGISYIGNFPIPYSNTTWNDPNHSYRAWGNDGSSFDQNLTVQGNTMVGPAIAQALIDAANNQGHLPVFLDLRLPAAIDAPALIDLGTVPVGTPIEVAFEIAHAGDVALWGPTGLETLHYTMAADPGLFVPDQPFALLPGQSGTHTLIIDRETPGIIEASIVIASNALDTPEIHIPIIGQIVDPTCGCIKPTCPGDLNADGVVDTDDLAILLSAFGGSDAGDLNGDGVTDTDDLAILLAAFGQSC